MPTSFGSYDPGDLIQDTHVEAFNAPINNLESGATFYGEAGNPTGTSTDDYSVTVNAGATPSYSVALTAGLMVHLKLPSVPNTKPATLSVNAATAKPIKKIGQNLQAGDLPADAIAVLVYDAELDVFQLIAVGNQVQPEDIKEVASDRLLGRDTAGTGACEELTVSGGLEFTGSGGVQRSALTGDVTASAGSNATTIASNAVTTAKIANDAVTYAKMQNVSATDKMLGRATAGAGDVEEIACTAAGRALLDDANAAAQRSTLGLGTAATSNTGDFAAASHTHASADVTGLATDRLLGRDTGGTGAAEQLTVGGGLEFTGSGGVQRSALTGDVTASAGSNATTIASNAVTTAKVANDAVTYAKMQNVSATDKLLGRSTAGAGDVEEIACTAAGRALLDDANAAAQRTTLGLGTAATSNTGDFAAASHAHAAGDITSGTLPVARGGTNLSSFAAGSLVYASAVDMLAGLTIGSTGDFLRITSGMPAWSNTIPLLILGSDPGIVAASVLRAMGFSATLPVAALRQDNGSGGSVVLDLYSDHTPGAAGTRFLRCYRDAANTPLLVAEIDTRGAFVSRPQASGLVGLQVAAAAMGASVGNTNIPVQVAMPDDGSNSQTWFQMVVEQRVVADGTEDARLWLYLMSGGTIRAVWVVDEEADTHSWLLNNATRMVLTPSFLRSVGGLRTGGNADPTAIVSGTTLFSAVTPHAEMLTGAGVGTYEDLVVIRHSGHDGTAVLRRLGFLLKLSGEASTSQSDRCGGLVLESNDANALNPHLFVVVEGQKTVEFPDGGGLNVITGNLAVGGTDITATPAELNLLDITGRSAGDALLATGATSAAWRSRALQRSDTRVGFACKLGSDCGISSHASNFTALGSGAEATQLYDSDAFFNETNGQFTPTNHSGFWRVSMHVAIQLNGTGVRTIRFRNSTDDIVHAYNGRDAYSGNTVLTLEAIVELTSGKTYVFEAQQNSGSTLNALANFTHFSAEFLGA